MASSIRVVDVWEATPEPIVVTPGMPSSRRDAGVAVEAPESALYVAAVEYEVYLPRRYRTQNSPPA
jgi:hypothetical protein